MSNQDSLRREYYAYRYLNNTDLTDEHLREVKDFLKDNTLSLQTQLDEITITLAHIYNEFSIDDLPKVKEIISAIEKVLDKPLQCDLCEDTLSNSYFDVSIGWFNTKVHSNVEYPFYNTKKFCVCLYCKERLNALNHLQIIQLTLLGVRL